ncbi:hypothetical protein HDU86_007439 [Geranomyces michiganensis]|nr:hypothetical protein HDU86_007439 [Geranomyces michiganensis]
MSDKISSGHYDQRIREILATSDLSVVSAKAIRRQLAAETGDDLDSVKHEIDAQILHILSEMEETEDESGGDEEDADDKHAVKKEVKVEETLPKAEPPAHPPPPRTAVKREKTRTAAAAAASSSSSSYKRGTKIKSEDFVSTDDDGSESDGTMARRLQEEESGGRPRRSAAASSGSTTPKKKKPSKRKGIAPNNGFNRPLVCSPALSSFLNGETEIARPEVVKRIWDYVKAHDLQDSSDKRYIIIDDTLRPVLGSGKRVHMFTMNKILSKHLKKAEDINGEFPEGDMDNDNDDDDDASNSDADDDDRPVARKKAKLAKAKKEGGGGGRGNAFMKVSGLSPELQAVVNAEKLARPHVVKKIWEYIKGNKLQDPNDGRFILCDDNMKKVFKTNRLSMFKMNSLLSDHIYALDE